MATLSLDPEQIKVVCDLLQHPNIASEKNIAIE